MNETWLPIPGYDGAYSISDHGRVRSEARTLTRRDGITRAIPEKVLNPGRTGDGYLTVRIRRRGEDRPRTIAVHHLVLAAFVGPCPDGLERLHGDDDKANNHLSNLRYGTRSENNRDCVRNGRHYQANKTQCVNGHEYSVANTYTWRGERRCRRCRNTQLRARRAAQQRKAAA